MTDEHMIIHATCIALGGQGVLIIGPPGSGKSDLALRLIDCAGRGIGPEPLVATLVSDDQTLVERRGGGLFGSAPASIAGKLEIRGLGIVEVPCRAEIRLNLAVRLLPFVQIDRLPAIETKYELCGLTLPMVTIDATGPSAPARIRAALHHLAGG